MKITTTYKHIKHGYVRTTPEGGINISIPRWKRFDLSFKQALISKGERLLARKKHITHIQRMTKTHVSIRGDMVAKKDLPNDIDTHLRTICHEQAIYWADIYSQTLGYPYQRLRVKKVRSKRGSCSSKQNININLDLVHLDKQFLEYVVAHEVTHLQHKHHQALFWQTLEHLYPQSQKVKKKLRHIQLC